MILAYLPSYSPLTLFYHPLALTLSRARLFGIIRMIIYNTCEMLSENINYVFYESLTSIAPSVPTHTSTLLCSSIVGALPDS